MGPSKDEVVSKKILGSIKGKYTGDSTRSWIANLDADPSATKQAIEGDPIHLSSIACLDQLFDDFQRYGFEIANSAIGDEITVLCARPSIPLTSAKSPLDDTPVIVQGLLTTGTWALVMQAQINKVRAFIVPQEYIESFPGRESFFTTYMEMDAFHDKGVTVWKIYDQLVLDSMLPYMSKKLFGNLLRVTKGEDLHAELFSLEPLTVEEFNDMAERLLENERTLLMAYDGFMTTLDHEVERLGNIALKGLQTDDLENTRRCMQRAHELKKIREKLSALGLDLNKTIADN